MLNYSSVAVVLYKVNYHMEIISYACCANLLFDSGNYKNYLGKMSPPFRYLSISLVKKIRVTLKTRSTVFSLTKTLPY